MTEATARPVAPRPRTNVRQGYLAGLAVVICTITFIGFSPTFFLRTHFHPLDMSGSPNLPFHLVLHGAALTTWYLLFFTQTMLIATRHPRAHRRLGIAGIAAAALVIATTLPTIVLSVPRLYQAHNQGVGFLTVISVIDIVLFPSLVGAALLLRRKPEIHKRLMVLAAIAPLTTAETRIAVLNNPVLLLGTQFLLWALLVVYDLLQRRRIHKVTAWGSLVVAKPLVALVLSFTPVGAAILAASSWLAPRL